MIKCESQFLLWLPSSSLASSFPLRLCLSIFPLTVVNIPFPVIIRNIQFPSFLRTSHTNFIFFFILSGSLHCSLYQLSIFLHIERYFRHSNSCFNLHLTLPDSVSILPKYNCSFNLVISFLSSHDYHVLVVVNNSYNFCLPHIYLHYVFKYLN